MNLTNIGLKFTGPTNIMYLDQNSGYIMDTDKRNMCEIA